MKRVSVDTLFTDKSEEPLTVSYKLQSRKLQGMVEVFSDPTITLGELKSWYSGGYPQLQRSPASLPIPTRMITPDQQTSHITEPSGLD